MDCLGEDTILAFCRGEADDGRRAVVERHIAECDECRALVSEVARTSPAESRDAAGDLGTGPTELADSGDDRLAARPASPARPRAPAAAPVSPGEVLAGKYVVDDVLGSGGMGVVVSARQQDLDRPVALKFLLPAACEIPGAVARFLREGKAAARITSEHVARVLDTGTLEGGAPYLVMERLEGSDLARLVAESGPLSPADAVAFVLQACEAIVEAHTLGIIHRDLKPANLFLTRRADGSPFVKVLDFGISKIEGGSRRDLTTASMLMGSPRYMSPEQMVSAKDVDARTDVWALGVILYELVTGKPVWEAETLAGLSALVATAPAPPLRAAAPSAPALLEQVVARCLTKDRDARTASVADLAIALRPLATGAAEASVARILGVAGRAGEATSRAEARASRSIALVGAGIGALLALGVVLNVAISTKPDERRSADVPAAPSAPASDPAPAPEPDPAPAPATTTASASSGSSTPSSRRPVTRAPREPDAAASPAAAADAGSPAAPDRALIDRK